MFDYIERHHAFDTFQVRHFAIDQSPNPAQRHRPCRCHAVRQTRAGLSTERAPVRVRAARWLSAGTHMRSGSSARVPQCHGERPSRSALVRSAHRLPLNRIGLCCAAGVDSRVQSPCAEHVQVEVHAVPRLPHLRLRNPGRWVGASVCAETGQCRPARYARPSVTARCRTVPHGLLGQAVCTRTRICICI
jgi:hypothetical protein